MISAYGDNSIYFLCMIIINFNFCLFSEGWEKLGLYEYYRAKNLAKKRKEEEISQGIREKSKSPSPVIRSKSRSQSPTPKKRYRRFVEYAIIFDHKTLSNLDGSHRSFISYKPQSL